MALLDKTCQTLSPIARRAVQLPRAARWRHEMMQERWLSVEEIAAHLGVNRDTIYKWLVRKKMPAHKIGSLWKFLASEVDARVKAGKAAQPKPSK